MIDKDDVVAWFGGTADAARRVHDGGFAFWVDTQPADGPVTYGNGPIIVLKRTGEGWRLASNPDSLPMHHARSEREFRKAWRTAFPRGAQPHFLVPPRQPTSACSLADVRAWVRHELGGADVVEYPVAFLVDPAPTGLICTGPHAVVHKGTGQAWFCPPADHPAYLAGSEAEFDRLLIAQLGNPLPAPVPVAPTG